MHALATLGGGHGDGVDARARGGGRGFGGAVLVEAGHDLASALLGEPPDAGGGAGVSLGALTVVEAVHGEEFLAELDVRLHLRRVGGGG